MGWPAGVSPASDWFSRRFARVAQRVEAPRRSWRGPLAGGVAVLAVASLAAVEMKTSWAESRVLARMARKLTFTVAAGPSDRISFPDAGPYDRRLGYAMLPAWIHRLENEGYVIEQQARVSESAMRLARFGIYPIYREKNQAGIQITSDDGGRLYSFQYPRRTYPDFESIPPIVVQTLLFIENRHLLDTNEPYDNPAIEWGRLAHAAVDFGIHKVDRRHSVIGGSTLATQLEKLRHSPEGRTGSPGEKLRQITSASLRIYREGPETLNAQRRVILDYINSIPLSATPGQGELSGLGDGLAAWYGADFEKSNRLLAVQDETALSPADFEVRARDYREALSLLLALREPSRYLGRDPQALGVQTDRYLRALKDAGVISLRLRDAALKQSIWPLSREPMLVSNFVANKASQAIRIRLLDLLGIPQTYLLDRVDLQVQAAVNQGVQKSVTDFFEQVADPNRAEAAGLTGYQLLPADDSVRNVIYSFALYQRGPGVNYLRVQTDNLNQPLSINDGTKLQLGSTAKLRTLIDYLQIVEELHREYARLTPEQLLDAEAKLGPGDKITLWALDYMATGGDRSLDAMLKAALDREYSGNPGELFFTAGGQHQFENFERKEDFQSYTVAEGFQQSVNLVYIRLMRDIENFYKWRAPGASPAVLSDPNDPARAGYLQRFADEEGSTFLSRFYAKYHSQSPDQALETLIEGIRPAPWRVAAIYRAVRPDADFTVFSAFMSKHVPADLLGAQSLTKLYENYGADKFSLADRGYLAKVHPLELWLVGYLSEHPQATLSDALTHSSAERQEVYRWLFRAKERKAQDLRIGIILEQDAFHEMWKDWKKLGYPFDSLVPSYATAIGVSGDTPSALAELAGIIANDGVLYPAETIRQMRFGAETPMETVMAPKHGSGARVLSPEIARLVHEEMIGVVQNGTARRAARAFVLPNGDTIPVAGKTGTGDNRFKVFTTGHQMVSDRPVNRTATFVFIVGDRLFGTATAFVPAQNASSYEFTSALAVQILKDLAPRIQPLLDTPPADERE